MQIFEISHDTVIFIKTFYYLYCKSINKNIIKHYIFYYKGINFTKNIVI